MSDLLLTQPIMAHPLLFKRPNGGLVKVTSTVHVRWSTFKQNTPDAFEAGGVLLGRRILHTDDIIIDNVTSPMSVDRRQRTRFFRSTTGHQEHIAQTWLESDGAINYLGEWHTHPETTPRPSCVDKWDWKRLVRAAEYEGDELFFFIVGIKHTKGWEVCKRRRKIVPLQPIV